MVQIKSHHKIIATLIASAAIVGAGVYNSQQARNYPNRNLTPGLIRTSDVSDICGHTTGVYRNTTQAMKNQVKAQYGNPKGEIEIDHFYPLGIGGADDVKNLWPQPAPEFRAKDKIETQLRLQLCKGKITQDQAKGIIDNWTNYRKETETLGGVENNLENEDEVE